MTKRTKKIIVYFLLIVTGLFIMFKFYLAQDFKKWFVFAVLTLSSYFTIKLIAEITNLLYPATGGFDLSILFKKEKYKKFAGRSSDANKQIWTFFILSIVAFIAGAFAFSNFTKFYKLKQLTKFGQTQKIIISNIHKLGKGSNYSFFNIHLNGKKVVRHLYKKSGQNIGDTCLIIYSTENVDIIEWAEDFKLAK